MTSDQSSIEAIAYLGCGPNRLSRIELLQQQQTQQYRAAVPCEHECNCMHHPLANNHHHHHSNFSTSNVSPNGAYSHHNNIPNHNHLNQHQHMHPTGYNMNHPQQQGMLIYNNGSTNSECNQASNNDSSQSGCSNSNMIHYIPTSNLSVASQSLNIPNVSCECAGHIQPKQLQHHHQRQSSEQHSLQSGRSSRIISCDENNPSGTEDGSGMSTSGMITACRASRRNLNNLDNQQRLRSPKRSGTTPLGENDVKSNQDDIKYSNRMDIYSDSNENAIKINDEPTSEDDRPPRLPPRPAPRPRNTMNSETVPHQPGVRKYVIWCLICGGILCLLGVMFLAVYFLLRSYTSTVGYFETVPPFVPATLLLLTGLCIMSLARRRNRYSYLIKLSGACSLASAITCALVTVTTTVIHMSRLQALRECQYTQKTRTCTCSSTEISGDDTDEGVGVRFVFDATTDCSVVHGALYSCLRAVFGLSVAGVFVSVFSCMLVYQLLSHERKKMYWEQLELRCRSLYSGAPPMPPGPAIIGTPGGGPCRCCEQCHAHRAAYSWDGDSRFWAGQAGNFYSPNPGGDEGNRIGTSNNGQRNRSWNWPWSRQRQEPAPMPPPQAQAPPRFHGPMSSSDSQYGFSNGPNNMNEANSTSPQNGYSVIGAPYGVWGPPPPYSDPNSPARRGRYHYIHPNQCHPHSMLEHHIPPNQPILECQNSSATDSHSEQFCQQGPVPVQGQQPRNSVKRQTQFKAKENFENAPSDSDGGQRDRSSNTLPVRKTKKRVDPTANKSIGPNQPQPRVNVQKVFNNLQTESNHQSEASENEYNEPSHPNSEIPSVNPTPQHAKTRRMPQLGIENTGFQPIDAGENGELINGNAESEVYFADVSSCCNISVKNDNYYEDATQRRSNKADKVDADEYLSQRFGKKDSSIRSRLPFPQLEDFEKSANKIVVPAPRPSIIQKETSRQSMCSIDSSEKTDFTDLSPATPTANFQPYPNKSMENYHQHDNFVASFPYNETSQEAHRRSTKNIDIFLSSDSQYETIRDSNQYETTPLTLNYELNHDMSSSSISSSSYSNNKSSPVHYSHNGTPTNKANPKSVNVTPIKRTNLGTNISAIIQNLSSDLYPEQSPQHKQKQDCNDIINDNIVVNSNSCSEKQKEWSELNGNDRRL